jgi:hypothetical protein
LLYVRSFSLVYQPERIAPTPHLRQPPFSNIKTLAKNIFKLATGIDEDFEQLAMDVEAQMAEDEKATDDSVRKCQTC